MAVQLDSEAFELDIVYFGLKEMYIHIYMHSAFHVEGVYEATVTHSYEVVTLLSSFSFEYYILRRLFICL